MSNYYVFDTNVLLHSPRAIKCKDFEDGIKVFLYPVISEIDNHKTKTNNPELQYRARRISRTLKEIRKDIISNNEGSQYMFANWGAVNKIDSNNVYDKIDDLIINMIVGEKERNPENRYVLVTKDINMMLKADSLGIETMDYESDNNETQYTGFKEIVVRQEHLSEIIEVDELLPDELLEYDDDLFFYDNEYVICVTEDCKYEVFFRYVKSDGILYRVKGDIAFDSIQHRNKHQRLAMESLNNENIVCTSIVGTAGCGKSLLAIAYAIKEIYDENSPYKKFLYLKPLDAVGGKEIGYLPGDKQEKLEDSVMGSFLDSIEVIFQTETRKIAVDIVQELIDRGQLEIEAVSFMRGRSFNNTILILDEVQNSNKTMIHTLLSRVGENCKVILMGDTEQIDNEKLTKHTNGLAIAVEKLKDCRLYSHIELKTSVRSEFAEMVSKLMSDYED